MNKKYTGIVVPAVTPLTTDYKLDVASVEKLLHHFYQHDVSPFILGTTGEAPSLPNSLKQEYIQLAGKLKKSGTILYAGISSNCLQESIELAQRCFDAGVDVVAATLPSYYALSNDEMLQYFDELAVAINGPLIIYNIPATVHMSIPLEVIDELSKHQNIVGAKDSERSEERLKRSLELWKDREDFSHFLGWAAKSAEGLLAGSDGLIPSTGNLLPQLYSDLLEASKNGDATRALALQQQSDILGDLYQKGRTLGKSLWALKVLMQTKDLCEANIMPPVQKDTPEEAAQLQEELQQLLAKELIN